MSIEDTFVAVSKKCIYVLSFNFVTWVNANRFLKEHIVTIIHKCPQSCIVNNPLTDLMTDTFWGNSTRKQGSLEWPSSPYWFSIVVICFSLMLSSNFRLPVSSVLRNYNDFQDYLQIVHINYFSDMCLLHKYSLWTSDIQSTSPYLPSP